MNNEGLDGTLVHSLKAASKEISPIHHDIDAAFLWVSTYNFSKIESSQFVTL